MTKEIRLVCVLCVCVCAFHVHVGYLHIYLVGLYGARALFLWNLFFSTFFLVFMYGTYLSLPMYVHVHVCIASATYPFYTLGKVPR